MDIERHLNDLPPQSVRDAFIELIREYSRPAFGSMSKRDLDILLFMKLQKLGVFGDEPELYELVSTLRITRSKARNLLYESKLRQTSTEMLDEELKQHIKDPLFLSDGDKFGMELENPFLIDHLRYRLKHLGHITDGSFSPELVKLTADAFVSLFDHYMPDDKARKEAKKMLIEAGVTPDDTFKGVLKGALKTIGTKVASEAGGELAGELGDRYMGPLLDGSIAVAKSAFTTLFSSKAE